MFSPRHTANRKFTLTNVPSLSVFSAHARSRRRIVGTFNYHIQRIVPERTISTCLNSQLELVMEVKRFRERGKTYFTVAFVKEEEKKEKRKKEKKLSNVFRRGNLDR